MRFLIALIAITAISTLGFSLYKLYGQKSSLATELEKVEVERGPLDNENKKLLKEISYFDNPDNLEKELRARFNYAEPNEKLLIVIPKQ